MLPLMQEEWMAALTLLWGESRAHTVWLPRPAYRSKLNLIWAPINPVCSSYLRASSWAMEELDPELFSNIWLLGDLVAHLEKVEGRASAVQSKCTCTSPFLGVSTEVLSTCSLSCETSVAVWVQTPITAWRKTASASGLSGNKETFTVFEKIVA